MSDVRLAKPYAPEKYAQVLENLANRYKREGEPVTRSDVAFNEVSEDQGSAALSFFEDIGLIERGEERGSYVPPEEVITWQLSMEGEAKKQAKRESIGALKDYELFSETEFLLKTSEGKEFSSLMDEVGGKIGIIEEDQDQLERTFEVLAEVGFLEIDEENVVTLPEDLISNGTQEETASEDIVEKFDAGNDSSETDTAQEETDSKKVTTVGSELDLKVTISLDATELEKEEMKEKLEMIEEVALNDGE